MTRWLIYTHKFNYTHMCNPPKECLHENCNLQFMVAIDEQKASQEMIKNAAALSLEGVADVTEESKDKLITYEFGSLSSNDMIDDVKKLFLANLPDCEKKVQLRLDKDDDFALFDDGSDVN